MSFLENDAKTQLRLYKRMFLIRKCEETIEILFEKGLLRGTSHGCRGQEIVPAAFLDHININADYVTGNHRSHGAYLAITENPYALIAEMMGLPDGMVQGRGGSQHIRYNRFYTNGITGGMVPVAVGLAFCQKKQSNNDIVISFFGDGAMNEGYVLEALNLSMVFEVPIVFVLENNHYAMSTATELVTKRPLFERAKAFGLETYNIEASDAIELWQFAGDIIGKIRVDRKPRFIEVKTFRFSGHSKNDKREYIPKEEDEYWKRNDPLLKLARKINTKEREFIEAECNQMISSALSKIKGR